MVVQSLEANPFDFVLEPYATAYPFDYEKRERIALAAAVDTPEPDAEAVMDWFRGAVPSPMRHAEVVQFLSNQKGSLHKRCESGDEDGEKEWNLFIILIDDDDSLSILPM